MAEPVPFSPLALAATPVLFFTGKGGVGKTSCAAASAVMLAEKGRRVLLVSTDPASNLQDIFSISLSPEPQPVAAVPGLYMANVDPMALAAAYRESVVAPMRGLLPEEAIRSIEEQLSGSCTVEIATFNAFADFLVSEKVRSRFDHIVFDTAPTGHTIRLLQLPSAWNSFFETNQHGASCLGPLSGLGERRETYARAVAALRDSAESTLVLVARPEAGSLREVERTSAELAACGLKKQCLILNGLLPSGADDACTAAMKESEASAVKHAAELPLEALFTVTLKSFNITGLEAIRGLFHEEATPEEAQAPGMVPDRLEALAQACLAEGKRVIFTMGKGGVGKTTVAAALALQLSRLGARVHLASTDPACHLDNVITQQGEVTVSHIDEEKALSEYREAVLSEARNVVSAEDLAMIEEDLRSPCTQEIAVFRAFASLVARADDEIVVIDTAPTGHTLLLLDATLSYQREIERRQGLIPESVRQLLPRLRSAQTAVCVVTLAEATPVIEAGRLVEDLQRAGLRVYALLINASLAVSRVENRLLRRRAQAELEWIARVREQASQTGARVLILPRLPVSPRDRTLLEL